MAADTEQHPPELRRTLLSILILVFAAFILLLLGSSYIGMNALRSVEAGAVRLIEEQRSINGLIDDIQQEEYDLDAIFYAQITGADQQERARLLGRLSIIEARIEKITASGLHTRDAARWERVKIAMEVFIKQVRRSLQSGVARPALQADVLIPYQQRVDALSDLVRSSYQNAVSAENAENTRLKDLILQMQVLLTIAVLLAVGGAALTIRITTRLSKRLEWQATELTRLSASLLENQEATARRFSRELHDEFGQTLSAVEANIIALKESQSATDFAARVEDCLLLVKDAIGNVRELSHLLRPSILDDFGLDASLQWLTDGFTQRMGIAVKYESRLTGRPSGETETHLFRIAQEAFTNIARHSAATQVKIALEVERGMLSMTISDNGKGLQNVRASHGMGLIGMRARARGAGGELAISSPPGGGVTIRVHVPFSPESAP